MRANHKIPFIAFAAFALTPISAFAADQPQQDSAISEADLKAAIKLVNAVEKDLRDIDVQIRLFAQMNGRFPTTEEGLGALVYRPIASAPRWLQLFKVVPTDPWGRPYSYTLKNPCGVYDLYSRGPDPQDSSTEIHLSIQTRTPTSSG